jgi:colicin import membrane protein
MRASLKPLGDMIAIAILAAGAALAAPAVAQTTAQNAGQEAAAAPSVPPTQSVEQADAKLAQVAKDRAAVNDEYAESERVCYGKFFVNNCLDKAKEKRRVALASIRAVEVEAEHFKRAASVQKRDADLAERARKDAEDQAARSAQPPKEPKVVDDKPHSTPASGPSVAEREAEHAAKEKRQQAQDAAEAGKRAANAAAFERKKEDSVRRQADVERKKQENANKQAAKAASDKKRAEADAAAAAAAASKK